jgi:hypothetical protein
MSSKRFIVLLINKINKMKSSLFMILFLVFSSFSLFSQDRGYIGVSIGPSIPTGDFSSKDMYNQSAGFAKTGAIFDISFGYKLGKNFGLTAILRGQANKVDAQAISDEMSKEFMGDFVGTVRTGSWGIGGLLVGGYSSISVAKQLNFESRLMLGFLSATSPDMTINLTGPGGTGWVKQSSTSGTAFAYLAGIGLKYNAGKRVCLLANIDYLGAKPEFEDVETTTSMGDYDKSSYTQKFGSFNIGLGVGYRL